MFGSKAKQQMPETVATQSGVRNLELTRETARWPGSPGQALSVNER